MQKNGKILNIFAILRFFVVKLNQFLYNKITEIV